MASVKQLVQQKMGDLLSQPESLSSNETSEEMPDSSAASTPSLISNEKFGRLVFNELLRVLHTWDRSSGTAVDEGPLPENVWIHAIKNTRRKMEDKHVALPTFGRLFDLGDLSYYAVFDGHGGVDAAKYASIQLHARIGRQLQSQQPKQALHDAFLDTDRMFGDRAGRENLSSGSTAVCVLVEGEELHVAWLGDSQALLVRDGLPIKLVTPHKPEDESEKKRIEEQGGCVIFIGAWRVNGTLSVSRAIGDAFHKPCISGEPDVVTVKYQTGDWLILGCDGLWDQLTYEDAARIVSDETDTSSTPAQRLVRAAKDNGSSDNISTIVIRLTLPANPVSRGTNVPKDPVRTAEMKADTKSIGGSTGPRTDPGMPSDKSAEAAVGQGMVASITENSRLAVSMKRIADSELEVSDDEKLMDAGWISGGEEELVSGSSVDVHQSSSQGSCQNFLHLSKVGSLEDALMAVAADFTSEFSPSSSGPSDIIRTTSEDTSGQSPDPSMEAGTVELRVASMHKRTKRQSMSSWQRRQKENRRPSDDADQPGVTPPCLRAGSPLMCEDDVGQVASSLGESCCRSLSLPSGSGALLNMHHSGGAQRMASTARPVMESRGRISAYNAPSRWTIAVEVDADMGMFEENSGIVGGPPNSAMNLSSHW